MRPWFRVEAVATNVESEVILCETVQLKRHCATTAMRQATSPKTVIKKLYLEPHASLVNLVNLVKEGMTGDADQRAVRRLAISAVRVDT